MQSTSQTWRDLFAAGAPLQARATIAGTVYTEISAPVIHRAAMSGGLAVGNVAAASLSLVVRGAQSIPRSAAVVIETRLNDGQAASEWLPQGTFYISRRTRDPVTGLLALECYDALLKAQAVVRGLPWTTKAGEPITTRDGQLILFRGGISGDMKTLARDMALLLGLQIDPRTVINEGPAYYIEAMPAGTTIRDVLSVIAQANGGNWIVTPQNRLRLVPVADVAGAAEAEGDVLAVEGVTGSIDAGGTATITGLRGPMGADAWLIGDDSGIVLDVSLTAILATELAETLLGRRYQPFDLTGAVCDPAAEIGDFVRAGAHGEIASALYSQQITLGPAPRSQLAALQPGELTDEYPYIGSGQKTLALAKAAVDEAVEALDIALTQQEIFNRLTDNGAVQGLVLYNGQLYVNASYIQSGTLKLGGLDNTNGTLAVLDAAGNVIGALTNEGLFFQGSNATDGFYVSPTGSIAIGERPEDLELLNGNTGFQALSSGIVKLTNIYFYSPEGNRCACFLPDNTGDGGVVLWGTTPGQSIASLSSTLARFYAAHTYLDGHLSVMGDVSLNNPLTIGNGGTGATTPTGARAKLGAGLPTGTFTTADGKTVTVTNGFVTGIA